MQNNFSSGYISILNSLGLSDYESRVFITLVGIGPTNYRVLVRESNVPTGKIYQVLSTLESKGFIEIVEGKPKLFRAIEPKKAFRRRLRQIEDDYSDLEHRIGEALQNLQFEYNQKYDKTQGIVTSIVAGSKAFESVVKENLFKAEDEVLISSSELIPRLHLEEVIQDLRMKKVCVNMLCSSARVTDNGGDGVSNLLLDLGVNSRESESIPSKYIVVDSKSVSLF